MTTTRAILNTISSKAMVGAPPATDTKAWHAHWSQAARAWHAELLAEGLTATAAKVADEIKFAERQG